MLHPFDQDTVKLIGPLQGIHTLDASHRNHHSIHFSQANGIQGRLGFLQAHLEGLVFPLKLFVSWLHPCMGLSASTQV